MPTLTWAGKEAVVNHHQKVPFHLLKDVPSLSVGDPGSGNLIVEGDNLVALKALLPYYAGQVKCIYIDPPYNTGNEKWVYNDNVNSPVIKKWLGQVVGDDASDLSRHDKWLCMMYPRLVVLRKLLCEDGLIFISIDDNEAFLLKCLLDEVFDARNFVQAIIWKNKYGPGAMTKGFGNVHEYIYCYSKKQLISIEAPLSEDDASKYKGRDSKYPVRGGFITQPLATRSKDHRPNLIYPITHNGEEIWPDKQWIWAKDRMMQALADDEIVVRKSKGKWSVRFKQYLKDQHGQMRMAKPISILNGPFNQDGTWEIEQLFGKKAFPNPKPVQLAKHLLSMIVNGVDGKDGLYLDSFAGSGTTGQAVLEMNQKDEGNRKFILIEMDSSIARTITSKRLEKVQTQISNTDQSASNQGFRYCDLGPSLFDQHGAINPDVKYADLARHVYFTETGEPLPHGKPVDSPLLGISNGVAIYLLFNGILGDRRANGGNILTRAILAQLPPFHGQKIIYAAGCLISEQRLRDLNIAFRQTPYEIKVT